MNLYEIRRKLLMGEPLSKINLRVTFYSRVSTENKEQQKSLINQITYFKEMIESNNNWIYVEGYVDEGISGTSASKRNNFMKMINDAYKDKFQELSKELTKEEVDEKEYARILSELFVIDLFDLNSKVSNTDIGGIDLFYPSTRGDFAKTEESGMYKYIESNVYGGRKQTLPVVTSAVATVEATKYEGKITTDENAYKATVDITYKKDLEYPTKVYLTLVHSDNKLFVINIK